MIAKAIPGTTKALGIIIPNFSDFDKFTIASSPDQSKEMLVTELKAPVRPFYSHSWNG